MKIIVFECDETESIINHFLKYDNYEFIIFENLSRKFDIKHYRGNITTIKGFLCETNLDKLLKIKGSLKESFFIVYSKSIINFDIKKIINKHKSNQKAVTLVENNKALCAALLENETLDYTQNAKSLEGEVFLKIGEDEELTVYK
ncbi:MAG: hypothetical protein J6D23_04390 [Clostridia bacterium]|nr:hypothetical protein [Clostridia bacterium]